MIQKRLGHNESVSEISMDSEDAHFNMEAVYGFIDAGSIVHGSKLGKEFDF